MRPLEPAFALVALFGLVTLGSSDQDERRAPRGPSQEPPLRARVSLDGERIEVSLGTPGRTADGRSLMVELLPTRVFEAEGSFRFGYPRDWEFLGASESPHGGWWTLSGDEAAVHLRRHDRDVDEVLEQYVAGLESMGKSERAPAELELDGRTLAGSAVEYDVGSIGPGQARRWVQECYAWTESEGVGWLLTLQRDLGPVPGSVPPHYLPALEVTLDEGGNLIVSEAPVPAPAPAPRPPMLADFRWE